MSDSEFDDLPAEGSFEHGFWDSLGTGGKALPLDELARLAMQRPITPDDIRYLLSCYPYLDICNSDARVVPTEHMPVTIRTAQTGWQIHDRGDRLTASAGRFVFGGYRLRDPNMLNNDDEDGGGNGGQLIHPEGTLVKQYHKTAVEMISIASQRWPAAEILGGYRGMQRSAWIAAQDANFSISYGPTAEDMRLYEVIKSGKEASARGFKPGKN